MLSQLPPSEAIGCRRDHGQGSIYQSADGTWHASLRVGRESSGKAVRRHVQAATRRQLKWSTAKSCRSHVR